MDGHVAAIADTDSVTLFGGAIRIFSGISTAPNAATVKIDDFAFTHAYVSSALAARSATAIPEAGGHSHGAEAKALGFGRFGADTVRARLEAIVAG